MELKGLCCNKNYQKDFDEGLKDKFYNIYEFAKHDISKFILLLQKFVYPYEYINYCEKVNGTSLPEIRDFYSHLNIENIIDTDYKHAKRFYKDFES